jgi:hypothetical protein
MELLLSEDYRFVNVREARLATLEAATRIDTILPFVIPADEAFS